MSTSSLRVNEVKFPDGTNAPSVISVKAPEYGAKGDGTTDDSAAVTAAIAAATAGGVVHFPAGNYKLSSAIAIALDNITFQGASDGSTTITQGTAGVNIFTATGHNSLRFRNINFVGISGATSFSTDSAIRVTTATTLKVVGCTFTNFRSYAITARAVSNLFVIDNDFSGCRSLLVQGGNHQKFIRNTVLAPQTPNTEFTVALQFDSTSSGFGASTNVTVTDNEFYNWPAGQAILLHTAQRFTVANNICDNVYEPINMSPVQAGDVVEDGTVTGNTCNVATTSGVGIISAGNYGIFAGGIAGQTAAKILILGNTVLNGNGYSQQDTWGAIACGTADDILIVGNIIKNAYGNGISLNGPNNRITVRANHIETVNNSVGLVEVGVGVWNNTAQTGIIDANFIDNVKHGIRLDVNTTGGVAVGVNYMTNIATARVLNPANGKMGILLDGGGALDTPGAGTLPIGNANATAITIGNTGCAVSANVASWAFNSPVTFVAGTGTQTGNPPVSIFKNAVSVPSVTSGEIDGQSFTLPANTLSANGQMISCHSAWTKAANANTVTHKFYIFGTATISSSTGTSAALADLRVDIVRVSSSSVRYFQTFLSAAGTVSTQQGLITGLDFTVTNIIKNSVTGVTSNGDTAATFLRCEWSA